MRFISFSVYNLVSDSPLGLQFDDKLMVYFQEEGKVWPQVSLRESI